MVRGKCVNIDIVRTRLEMADYVIKQMLVLSSWDLSLSEEYQCALQISSYCVGRGRAHCKLDKSFWSGDEQDSFTTRPLLTARSGSHSNGKEKSETGS